MKRNRKIDWSVHSGGDRSQTVLLIHSYGAI